MSAIEGERRMTRKRRVLAATAIASCAGALAGASAACGDTTAPGTGASTSGSGSGSSSGTGSSSGSSGGSSGSSGGGSSTSSGSTSGSSGGSASGSGGSSGSSSGGWSGSGSGGAGDAGNDGGAAADDGGDAAPPSGLVAAKDLVCTQLAGNSITYAWFTAGFDTSPLDAARFELKATATSGVSYTENWTDPSDPIWSVPLVSPCAASSDNPDRVIYVAVEWNFTTAAEWKTALDGVLATFKAKYSNLKRFDIMTMLRAPNNMICPGGIDRQVVAPFIDQAIQMEAQADPTFVVAAPKFYAPDCSVFQPNSEHPQPSENGAVAKVFQAYYANEP
jgi:hypothetical protein